MRSTSPPLARTTFAKNPLTNNTNYITGSGISTQFPLLPGDCFPSTLSSGDLPPAVFELDTFTKFYGMLGHSFPIKTPVSLSDFPFSPSGPECGYLNNFDSLTVPKNLCGDCEKPVTFVKTLGNPQQLDLAYSMCKSADGNVYIAGKQGDNPMIAKISTMGEPIWVRNFPPVSPNLPIEWAEIIEDSDQMLVLCGTEGGSASNRSAIVMRYDPKTANVLWYKRFSGNQPQASGVLEKEPGGNFILRTNYQQNVGVGGHHHSSTYHLPHRDYLPGQFHRHPAT